MENTPNRVSLVQSVATRCRLRAIIAGIVHRLACIRRLHNSCCPPNTFHFLSLSSPVAFYRVAGEVFIGTHSSALINLLNEQSLFQKRARRCVFESRPMRTAAP